MAPAAPPRTGTSAVNAILVSFCNTHGPGLGLLDPSTLTCEPLNLEIEPTEGFTGLAVSNGYVFAVAQVAGPPGSSELIVLGAGDLGVESRHPFRQARDVHSISSAGARVYAVSTGTDQVFSLDLSGPDVVAESPAWSVDGTTGADRHHLNAVLARDGDLLVSGFGLRAGSLWSSATNGFVRDVGTGRSLVTGIFHPHSLLAVRDTLAWCESSRRAVNLLSGESIESLPGYTRGLCALPDGSLLVGTSRGRACSKSSGLITNPADPGEPEGRCTVVRLDGRTLEPREVADLGAFAAEIYDLVAVPAR